MTDTSFTHKQTGTIFPNRKAAVVVMGIKRYNKFLANNEFEWH